jgi:hypothetical protein
LTDCLETRRPDRSGIPTTLRRLAVGAVAATALTVSCASAIGVSTHEAGRTVARPASHRLALTIKPQSVRLT